MGDYLYSYCPSGTSGSVFRWYIRLSIVQTSKNLCLHVFNKFYCGVMVIHCLLSDIGKCLRSGVSCSSDRNRCILSCFFSSVFYPTVSVGSPAAESVFTVFHLGRMENDVNRYSLKSIVFFLFLLLRVFAFDYCRMDWGVNKLGWMFSDVV